MALWADALLAFAYAYDQLIDAHARLGSDIQRPNVSCADYEGWKLGRELYSKFHRVDAVRGMEFQWRILFRFHSMELLVELNLQLGVNERVFNWILFISPKMVYPKYARKKTIVVVVFYSSSREISFHLFKGWSLDTRTWS